MAELAYTHFTPEEYLAFEREAEYRSEYISGQIIAMAGASRNHHQPDAAAGYAVAQSAMRCVCHRYARESSRRRVLRLS